MSKFKKKLVAVAAPSGGGKTTLCKMLCEKFSELALSISYTTRLPRGQERSGVEYVFVSQEEFEKNIRDGRLIEWAKVHDNFYGTSKDFIDNQIQKGHVVILDIDVQGVVSLKKVYGSECLSIFLVPPSMEELEKRLRTRQTEPEDKIQKRLSHAKKELDSANGFDYKIINDKLEKTFSELCTVLEREVGFVG